MMKFAMSGWSRCQKKLPCRVEAKVVWLEPDRVQRCVTMSVWDRLLRRCILCQSAGRRLMAGWRHAESPARTPGLL